MMLAGILLSERAVEELAFLLLDADELALALRLTQALERKALTVALSENDRLAILSAIIHGPRGLTELRGVLLDKRERHQREGLCGALETERR